MGNPILKMRTEGNVRVRVMVLAAALISTLLKLIIASRTYGTDDVRYWTEFAQGVRDYGPIGIYGHAFEALYNHPPLAGWMLYLLNQLVGQGISFPFLIRVPSSLADGVSALLVFELVRSVRGDRVGATAAILVAWSPLMFIVSGFHGNTDPVFVMFSLLTLYLLEIRHMPALAGLAFGAAISVKLVPIVLVPLLCFLLLRQGWSAMRRFAVAGVLVFAVLWMPVLVLRGDAFREQVLGYSGIGFTQWGIPQFLFWFGYPVADYGLLMGPGRYVTLAVSSLIPLVVARRRPDLRLAAAGLSFVLFLLLSPAFGMQYLVWPLAFAYLINPRVATQYNVLASLFAGVVYSGWNHAYPWAWYEARSTPIPTVVLLLMVLVWIGLASVAIDGIRQFTVRCKSTSDRSR